jgi:hypothetical protein
MNQGQTAASPEFKLRWYQFRLRTLLIFVFLAACVCSLIEVCMRKAWLQRRAVEEIVKTGGSVYYIRSGSIKDPSSSNKIDPATISNTFSLIQLIGYDCFYDVVEVDGFFPQQSQFAYLDALPHLKRLEIYLRSNPKDGLQHLNKLDKLESLKVGGNFLNDDIFKPLEKLDHLTFLEIRGKGPTDECLRYIQPLTSLHDLTLWGGNWTSQGIKNLSRLNPRSLTIYSTNNIDAGMVILEKMPLLEKLSFQFTPITNAGLKHLEKLPSLNELVVAQTNIDDDGLSCLKKIKSLRSLCLTDTNIKGSGLEALAEIKELQRLWLDGTKINDDSLKYLSKMKHLKYLDLSRTNITLAGLKNILQHLQRVSADWEGTDLHLELVIFNTPAAKSLQNNQKLLKEFETNYPDCSLRFK